MLKFSGYPHLIWDQVQSFRQCQLQLLGIHRSMVEQNRNNSDNLLELSWTFQVESKDSYPIPSLSKSFNSKSEEGLLILKQMCHLEFKMAQGAFKDLMIHGTCNSHYVSQFAAFFIVARAKRSVAKSFMFLAFMNYQSRVCKVESEDSNSSQLLCRSIC